MASTSRLDAERITMSQEILIRCLWQCLIRLESPEKKNILLSCNYISHMSYDTVIYIIRMTFDYHKDLIRTCLIVELRIACKLRYQLRDAARILPNDCRSCGHGARVTRRYFYRSCRCDFDTEMDFDIFCHFGAFCNIWPTFFHYVHSYMATSRHQCLHVCFLMVLI